LPYFGFFLFGGRGLPDIGLGLGLWIGVVQAVVHFVSIGAIISGNSGFWRAFWEVGSYSVHALSIRYLCCIHGLSRDGRGGQIPGGVIRTACQGGGTGLRLAIYVHVHIICEVLLREAGRR